ncbi:hypothetical protein EZI54_03805 [Marinobacter halodurans]|uniref:Uncharacterized protein n=1 Tax=Marinobacter halodurans TaxID=2528979 RepID=A0ABY1ZTF5_9GAMM|nr:MULTISPECIES: hypothetical protein [Marinobacter]ROT94596.1 hypothetical protein EB809_19235 [Marinobacter sp. R17]TBW58518.1 hypothetical protein EZI54_03805 [Marinobacter halodurans]
MVERRRNTRHALWIVLPLLSSLAAADDALFTGEALSADQLQEANGRQGIPFQWQVNDTDQNAIVADNVLNGTVITGDNVISDHAFDNMNGVATVIQNTGNHVVIQDSTQINVLINH